MDTLVSFDSVGEMLAHTSVPLTSEQHALSVSGYRKEPASTKVTTLPDGFYSSATFEDAADILRTGSFELEALIAPVLDKVAKSIGSVERNRVVHTHNVAGGSVNVARVMTGNPRNMRTATMVKTRRAGRHVCLLVNCAASCGVSADEMARRGAALVALVDALHKAGISADVYAGFGIRSGDGKHHLSITTRISHASGSADRSNIVYALGNGDWLRRFGFGVMERLPEQQATRFGVAANYGYPCEMNAKARDAIRPDVLVDSHMVGRMQRDPAGWVIEQLQALGITRKD